MYYREVTFQATDLILRLPFTRRARTQTDKPTHTTSQTNTQTHTHTHKYTHPHTNTIQDTHTQGLSQIDGHTIKQ